MIRFLKRAAAAVATPAAGRVTLYVDDPSGIPSYKKEDGTVSTLVGPVGPAWTDEAMLWMQTAGAPAAGGVPGAWSDEALLHMQAGGMGPAGPAGAAGSGGSGGGGGDLLALQSYAQATDTQINTSSTTLVDADATNLAVTFTTPASGRVLVTLLGASYANGTGDGYWALREGTTQIGTSQRVNSAPSSLLYVSADFLITGLTPGSVHTYKWAWKSASGITYLYSGPTFGSLMLQVRDADPAAGGSDLRSLIAQTTYKPAAETTISITSTAAAFADLDATNLAITFTAPASGKVNVAWRALREAPAGTNIKFALRDAAGLVAGTPQYSGHAISASANVNMITHVFPITGLTPGTSYTYKIAGQVAGGTGQVYIGNGAGANLFGPAVIEVWDAGTSGGGAGGVSAQTSLLAANVSIAANSTFYDGPSLSLVAGTYLLMGQGVYDGPTTWVVVKVWDGTTAYNGGHCYSPTPGGGTSVAVTALVTLTATTTVKLSMGTDTGVGGRMQSTVVGTGLQAGLPGKVTSLTALKIA